MASYPLHLLQHRELADSEPDADWVFCCNLPITTAKNVLARDPEHFTINAKCGQGHRRRSTRSGPYKIVNAIH